MLSVLTFLDLEQCNSDPNSTATRIDNRLNFRIDKIIYLQNKYYSLNPIYIGLVSFFTCPTYIVMFLNLEYFVFFFY